MTAAFFAVYQLRFTCRDFLTFVESKVASSRSTRAFERLAPADADFTRCFGSLDFTTLTPGKPRVATLMPWRHLMHSTALSLLALQSIPPTKVESMGSIGLDCSRICQQSGESTIGRSDHLPDRTTRYIRDCIDN